MRAADDFAVIRARTGKLETQRQWAAHKREQTARDEAPERVDLRVVQRKKTK